MITIRHALALAMAMLLLCLGTTAHACTTTSSITTNFGTFSPPAVKAGAVPAQRTLAGLTCTPSVIVLLGMNYIRAKFKSQNNMKLMSGTDTINYVASPDAAATVTFTQNGTVDYMQNNLLNVLGLLGGSSADFPFYVKPSNATLPPVGTYTDKVTINWDWYLCQGIGAFSLCVGTPDSGTATTVVDISLTVTPKGVIVTTSSSTTWDPTSTTTFPKALPGGRRRISIDASNPDIIALDSNSVSIDIPISNKTMVALDGDGTMTTTFIQSVDGSPTSNLAITYTSPSSMSDDVDFSSDGGTTWTYVPVSGNDVSQAAVTNMRLRPRGSMAAGTHFTISYSAKTK